MRIAVVGAGALGLFYGALLQRGGNDVKFLLRRDYDDIVQGGLQVHSLDGDFHLPLVAGFRQAEEIGIVDLVVIGLKSWANDHYPELVGPLVGPATMILTLQNGLGNESCWRSSSALTGSMAGSPTSAPTGGSPVRCIISAPGGSSWGRCILVTEFTPRSWPVSSRRREFPVKPWTTS